jgi:hypothetical protein
VHIESNKLNKNAHQKPFTENPWTNFEASNIMAALITRRKNPSVTNVNGSVSKIRIGLTIAFRSASTMAKMIAAQNVSICIPERICDNPNAITDVTIMRIRKFMVQFLLKLTRNHMTTSS